MKNTILITEETILEDSFYEAASAKENHFEYEVVPGLTPDRFGSANHADVFDAATQVPVYGQAYGYVRNVGQAVGGILGIGKEDKSDVGFKSFLSGFNGLPFYPTKDEVIAASQQGKWDPAEPAAIQASYNPSTGQWKRGDWNFQITSTSPIAVTQFKGAKERYVHSSTINAKPPMNQAPSNAMAQSQSPNMQAQQPSPSLTPQQQQIVAALPAGTTQQQAQAALAQAGVPVAANANPFTGAASAGGFTNNLFGGMSTGMSVGLIVGFLALVALIIWFASK